MARGRPPGRGAGGDENGQQVGRAVGVFEWGPVADVVDELETSRAGRSTPPTCATRSACTPIHPDRYGRLTSERFLAARTLVDTGLTVLGWSRDRAAACLRESGFMSEPEIASELLRYTVDDPGQALGYHAGRRYLRELRGTQNIREFHDAVLASGPSRCGSSESPWPLLRHPATLPCEPSGSMRTAPPT